MSFNIQKIFPSRGEAEADPDYRRVLAQTKRFIEYFTMVPGFKVRFETNPHAALAEAGAAPELSIAGLRMLLYEDEAKKSAALPPEKIPNIKSMYWAFFKEKLALRQHLATALCVPQEKRFAAWRNRQWNRCRAELGHRNEALVHAPIAFELSLGCSVGCPFCGVSAQKLQKVFRATPENRKLWQDILHVCRDIIGPATGTATCYFACEPFDCPDYEVFTTDFADILGAVPQLTTAVAMRQPERTREYLQAMRKKEIRIHRFSVLSLDILKNIMAFFTPEELLEVELLPQFPEAPVSSFVKAGRARSSDAHAGEDNGTISCVSGFIVNMSEQSIRLTTPCPSGEAHPTGEILIAKESFSDAADFSAKLKSLIGRYMQQEYKKTEPVVLRKGITFEKTDSGLSFFGSKELRLTFPKDNSISAEVYHRLLDALQDGTLNQYEIAEGLLDKYTIPPEEAFFLLNRFIKAGLCLEPYEREEVM